MTNRRLTALSRSRATESHTAAAWPRPQATYSGADAPLPM